MGGLEKVQNYADVINGWSLNKSKQTYSCKGYSSSSTKAPLHIPCINIALKRLENSVGLFFIICQEYGSSSTKAPLHIPSINIALKRLENSVGLFFKVHIF